MNDFIEVLQEKQVPYSIAGDKIFVAENLDLSDTSITSLPDNLRVGGWLDLSGTSITRLPKNLSVSGGLNLRYTDITSLPDNLNVGGSLDICYTRISSLPDTLKVGGFIYLHPEEITNIAYRKFLRDGDYTVFAAWINGQCCVVINSMIYTLEEFYSETPTADVEQAARECVDELKQRGEMEHYRLMKYCNIPLSEIPKAMRLLQKLMDVGYSAREIAQEALAEEAKRAENRQVRVWHYEICNVSGNWHEDETPHKPDEEMFVVRNVRPVYFGEYTEPENSTTWLNVSDCLPELDTPVFGGCFSDSGDFLWGCYVRTRFANSDGWVWAIAEHFGKGEWLFYDNYPVKYWMPLPGKPELVGGAA
ncbi:DUF551 domain-containing protein [Sodalis praecaptivus]|uniref:hypothetical protein n=1 Tax=Sodalis praecaptivus TaxID=1239307 RepID=UPI0031F7F338